MHLPSTSPNCAPTMRVRDSTSPMSTPTRSCSSVSGCTKRIAARLPEPTSMSLATVAPRRARPASRIVLLKGYDARGFVFYTNYLSRKGRELLENPRAALLFHWIELERTVRIAGRAERTSAAESDAYFASRPARIADQRGGIAAERRNRRSRGPRDGHFGSGKRSLSPKRYRVPRIGVAIAWCRSSSSSGRAVAAGCTTASAIPQPERHGSSRVWRPDRGAALRAC